MILKEEKDNSKEVRIIPLTELFRYILEKYNYSLPLVSNQKYNAAIKDVFKTAGHEQIIEKVTISGKKTTRENIELYKRISSHTARRTFITLMKEKGKSDKLIAQITGHKDMRTLYLYYQVRPTEIKKAVDDTFKLKFTPLKKVN